MKRTLRATLWIGAYLLLAMGPLVVLVATPRPELREFWREVAVALGFAGLALMGLQFIPTARLKFLSGVFPADTTYYFHHWTSVLSTLFIASHPIILIANNPNVLILFDLPNAPWRARAGIVAGLAVVLLTVLSVWRKEIRLEYEPWRVLHNVLAIGASGLAIWHIFGVRHYLDLPIQRVLWIGIPAVWAAFLAYTKVYKPLHMLRHPYRLDEIREERGNCWTLAVTPVGHDGFTFHPGQFAWLTIRRSPFAIREHPFSISSSAEQGGYLEFTIKELGDFTSHIGELEPGTRVYVDGPYGEFCIDQHTAPAYVFLAGGIGAAPMMSMLRTLADRDHEGPVYLFYGSLNWESVVYREELEVLRHELDMKLVHVLEEAPAGWEGETGFITTDMLDRYLPEHRDELFYFVSGPMPMIDAVKSSLHELDIPRSRVCEEQYELA